MTEPNGELEAYYERGWEVSVEFSFRYADSQELIFLKDGQHLTIFKENGDVL